MALTLKELQEKMHVSYNDPSKKVLLGGPVDLTKKPKDDVVEKYNTGLDHNDPPTLLILRRKAIRVFPDGKKVALYYSDKLGNYVTIPYGEKQKDVGTFDEELDEAVIHKVKAISMGTHDRPLKFRDGSTMKVDQDSAAAIMAIHAHLTDENKEKFEDMMDKDRLNFTRIAGFSKGLHTTIGQKKAPKKTETKVKAKKKKGK